MINTRHSRITLLFLSVTVASLSPAEPADVLPDEIAPGVGKHEMVSVWLKKRALAALDDRAAKFEKLTVETLEKWQQERKEFFWRQLGGKLERTPLNARVTDTFKMDGYSVEKLYFESQPGLHVTATLYLPDGQGPFPAVLHPTGHSANAKKRELYQLASIMIAKGGCACLCYDPIGQGERWQIFNPDGSPLPSTVQHTLIHHAAHLLGSNVARTMVWDGIRAIDYLSSRPGIDGTKIGCTGISGGGTNTSYLMALDDRITAAAPGCYLTGYRSLLNTIGPQDAEQNIHGQIAFGMDHADYVLMRLPKPTLIMAASRDYFDIHGAWRLFRQGKRFATRQGFPERVDLVEPDTGHGFPKEMRVAASNWMRRWLLKLDSPIQEGQLQPVPEERLNVTPNGRALDIKGARSILAINAERNRQLASARAKGLEVENRQTILGRVRELIGAEIIDKLPPAKLKSLPNGLVIQSEQGIHLPAVWDGPTDASGLTILVHGDGKAAAIESGLIKKLRDEFKSPVIAVDLRGLGETRTSGKRSGFNEYFGTGWKDTMLASLMGESLVGMRVEDIWQTYDAAQSRLGNRKLEVNLVAVGEAAIPALHAAALEPYMFSKVRISNCINSWTDVVEATVIRGQHSNLVFGALKEYDLPILKTMIGDTLEVIDPVKADGSKQ